MAVGNYHTRDHVNGLNVGTYLPVAVPIRLFGKSEIALSLWPLFCSLLGVVSIAGAAAILFGRAFGFLAALLYATYPGDVFFSTVVMPDSIQAGWLTFSIFLVVLAYAGPFPRRYLRLATGGVAMGCCHLIRANDVILVVVGVSAVVLFSIVWKHEPAPATARGCVAYLAGWLLVNALEGLVYLWAAGDFFHRLHVITRHYGSPDSIQQWGLNVDARTIPFSIFPPLQWWILGGWGHLNQDQAYHALTFLLALASLVTAGIALSSMKGRASDRALAGFAFSVLWFSWPLLYHQFGSQSLTHFVAMHRLSRHLVVYAPGALFATVAGLFLIKEAASKWRSAVAQRALTAAALAILLIHLNLGWKGEQIAHDSYQRIKGTYARIRERLPSGVQTIVADPGDLCFFDFWLNPLGAEHIKVVAFANYSRCEELQSGVVLTHSNPGWQGMSAPAIRDTVNRLPCLLYPPESWRLLYDGYPEKVFLIGPPRDVPR
jgi:4-amino-4-deoxy-L-arabinose transferase-like glycosyltransferase